MAVNFQFMYSERMTLLGHNYSGGIEVQITKAFSIDEALKKAEQMMEDYMLDELVCTNANTGEVIFIATPKDDYDEDGFSYEESDWDWEIGYNPYTGGYDYDC